MSKSCKVLNNNAVNIFHNEINKAPIYLVLFLLENRKDLLNCINICLGITGTYLLQNSFAHFHGRYVLQT